MPARRRACGPAEARGRLRKAGQFLAAAQLLEEFPDELGGEIGDAFVTLCVHAGIAAADAICCLAVGEHAQGDDHAEAVALLRSVSPGGTRLATALNDLLILKARAGYSHLPVSRDAPKRAARRARALVDEATKRSR